MRSAPDLPRAALPAFALLALMAWPAAAQTSLALAEGADDYEMACQRIEVWQQRFPDLVRCRSIGASVEGRPLTVVRISACPRDTVPEVYLGGGIHGVERSERDVLWMVEQLLARSDEPDIRTLLATRVLWVQPMVNPDGVYHRTRLNACGIDLNRNFGRHWMPGPTGRRYPGPRPFSEPETQALRAFLRQRRDLRAYLDLHRSARLVIVPEVAGDISRACWRAWAEMNAAMGGYDPSQHPLHTGAYSGLSIDWVWSRLGVMAFTWELLSDDDPSFRDDARWRGLLFLLRQAPHYPVAA